MWWLEFKRRSRIDSPTTALGKREYQSDGERFKVKMSQRRSRSRRSESSSKTSSA
jgi:hypothetical protein